MSLSGLRKLDERGVTFRSHIDGMTVALSPERAVEIQNLLGADIVMQLDECVKLPAERTDIERAMQLSLRWAERSKRAFEGMKDRALFGIVQGGDDRAILRGPVEGLLDRQHIGVARGLADELHHHVEAFERVVDQDVLLADGGETVAAVVADPFREARLEGRKLEVHPSILVTRSRNFSMARLHHGRPLASPWKPTWPPVSGITGSSHGLSDHLSSR